MCCPIFSVTILGLIGNRTELWSHSNCHFPFLRVLLLYYRFQHDVFVWFAMFIETQNDRVYKRRGQMVNERLTAVMVGNELNSEERERIVVQ